MAKQTNVLFPDWIFTGSLELTPEIEKGITNELSRLEREQEVTNTNFGWLTLKKFHYQAIFESYNYLLVITLLKQLRQSIKPH